MSLLRRLFGGDGKEPAGDAVEAAMAAAGDVSPDELEREREREVMRAEAERLDELQQRQLRYADRAWTPPAQGGERRADDEDASGG